MIAGIIAAFAEHWIALIFTHVGALAIGFVWREIRHAIVAVFLSRLQFWNRR